MASTVYVFMPDHVNFFVVFSVLLVSGLAGAIAHIPGGIGVLEATFVIFLGETMDKANIIAALLAYRCVYYLIPLFFAIPLYAGFEILFRKRSMLEGLNN